LFIGKKYKYLLKFPKNITEKYGNVSRSREGVRNATKNNYIKIDKYYSNNQLFEFIFSSL